jgi:hypothetical protein
VLSGVPLTSSTGYFEMYWNPSTNDGGNFTLGAIHPVRTIAAAVAYL